MKNLVRYFIQGILVVVPITITLYVLIKIVLMIGSTLNSFGLILHPVIDPFIEIVAGVVFITLLGFLGSSILFKPIFLLLENAIERAPLIKIIYSSIKDFLSAFVGSKKRFTKPVLIDVDKANGIQQLGFITQESITELGISMEDKKVAVYIPLSYAFSGKLLIVPAFSVKPLSISAADAMKFMVSGGVIDLD